MVSVHLDMENMWLMVSMPLSRNIYIYIISYYVQLPGSKNIDSQILMHYFTQNNDTSLNYIYKTRSWYMCNSPHTMYLCCMYINDRPTLDF